MSRDKTEQEGIATWLFKIIESAQQEGDRSLEQYKDDCIMPNDAMYLLRVQNVKKLCDILSDVIVKGKEKGMGENEIFEKSIVPNRGAITSMIPYTDAPLRVLIDKFTK